MPENKGHKNIRPIRSGDLTAEELHKRAANGGQKSGASRRAKQEARQAMRYMLDMEASDRYTEKLEEMGYPVNERTNLAALCARLYITAMNGSLDAFQMIMKIAGYEPEENRKERESLNAERRRERELEAKVNALEGGGDKNRTAISLDSEDGGSDVIIYLPELDRTEEESGAEKKSVCARDDRGNGGDVNAADT